MMKQTPRVDSAHQIGLSTSSKRKLIRVGECVMGGGLKIWKIEKIGNGFACYGRTGGAMMKRTPRLDSAHQIRLSTSSKGKLIIVGECVMGGVLKISKIEKIGDGFACYGRTGGAIMKWTPQLYSAHQIRLSTSSKGKLMVVVECVMGGF